jgi:glyoxylase-like metal-dependent hydrolase (beta-lactamase superfamily II)
MVDASLTFVDRGQIETDPNLLMEGYLVADDADPSPTIQQIETQVFNLIIDHPEAIILWDTGSHPDCGDGYWPESVYDNTTHYNASEHHLADDLEGVGYGIDEIDAVVQSHLHLDHAGGLYNFEDTDVPVYIHEAEFKHAYYGAKYDEGPDGYIAKDFDRELNWKLLSLDREERFTDIEFLRFPGHTPGVLGAKIDLEDDTVILTSDQFYLDPNYRDKVPLGAGLLWDREAWARCLNRIQDMERRHGATVVYGHDPEQFQQFQTRWQ